MKDPRIEGLDQYVENQMVTVLGISKSGFDDDEDRTRAKLLIIDLIANAYRAGFDEGAEFATALADDRR